MTTTKCADREAHKCGDSTRVQNYMQGLRVWGTGTLIVWISDNLSTNILQCRFLVVQSTHIPYRSSSPLMLTHVY